jgi:hypothetical protein
MPEQMEVTGSLFAQGRDEADSGVMILWCFSVQVGFFGRCASSK